jgi:hypothetical protein
MRAFIFAMALAMTTATAVAKDTSSANYVLPGCKWIIAWDEGKHRGEKDTDKIDGLIGGNLCIGLIDGMTFTTAVMAAKPAMYIFHRLREDAA